jgi:hypothetical protein
MSKFIKIEVTKSYGTDLYVEVPDDFEINAVNIRKIDLNKAAEETCTRSDWQEEENSVEWQSFKPVREAAAKRYRFYQHKPIDKRATSDKIGEVGSGEPGPC